MPLQLGVGSGDLAPFFRKGEGGYVETYYECG